MSAYTASLAELRKSVHDWKKLLDDPFKAPELKVGMPQEVWTATWKTSVEYEIAKRGLGEKP